MISLEILYYIVSIISIEVGIVYAAYKIGYNSGKNSKK